jgi:hypothetical protein
MTWSSRILLAVVVLVSACSSDDDGSAPSTNAVTTPVSSPSLATDPPSTTLASEPTAPTAVSTTEVAPSTTAAPTTEPPTTVPAPPTTAALVVPIEVIDGRFAGIGYGSLLPEAMAALPQFGAPHQGADLPFQACTNSAFGGYWLLAYGSLAIVFEGETLEQAHLTNWWYTGATVDGGPLMTARDGITVGSNRADIIAAYAEQPPDDLGDTILVDGSLLRFELEGDTVVAMGLIDCGD